jgi:heme oxygenase
MDATKEMHTARPFPPTKTDLLERLRSATQDVHVQIERSVRFLDPDATVNDYRDYLARLFGYVAPLEDRLAAVCSDAPDLEVDARRKAHLAVIDLRALGLPLYEIGRLPRCAALPDVSNLQRALGCLYVLEGSTLGGRDLEHQLSQLRPEAVATAHAYLRGYGRATDDRWNAYRAALEVYATDPASVLAAARQTSQTLHSWLIAEVP